MANLSEVLMKLKNAGMSLVESTGDDLVFKVPKELQQSHGLAETIIIPRKNLEGGFGKVTAVAPEEKIGMVLTAPSTKTSLTEMLQAKAQSNLMKKEDQLANVNLSKVREKLMNKSPITPIEHEALVKSVKDEVEAHTKATSLKDIERMKKETALAKSLDSEVTQDLSSPSGVKAAGMLAIPATNAVDMSPLDDIKAGYDRYKAAKDALMEAAAKQIDLTKDKSASEDISKVLGLVADPTNYIPGAPGLAAGALQLGLEALTESKVQKALRKK